MEIIDFILHIDIYLADDISFLGDWVYVMLFFIVFAEIDLAVMLFLPGDSLLFSVGTLAGEGMLNIWVVYFSLLIAAVLGDTVNYWIGNYVGPKVFSRSNSRFFNVLGGFIWMTSLVFAGLFGRAFFSYKRF